ncbi:hypothetical protein [Sphingomonas gei]|uniref:hypothetical protein n=1 Tax=Sphingomonas gei TaxID=1395960 RepID=UPI001440FE51|nr:hypothetical protein [Sphingomonas gei]
MDFDPEGDINVRSDGMLTISPGKTELESWANGFFVGRREDEIYQTPESDLS